MSTKINIFLIYFFLTIVSLFIHIHIVDFPQEKDRIKLHQYMIEGKMPAPYQYRMLPHIIVELMRIHLRIKTTDALVLFRLIATFLSAIAFHCYLSQWFDLTISFSGTLFYLAALPFTFFGYTLQPGDQLNLLFLAIGLILIKKEWDIWLIFLLPLAVLNREVALILVPAYFIISFGNIKPSQYLVKTFIYLIAGFSTYLGLRFYYGFRPYMHEVIMLPRNLTSWESYVFPIILFGPFLYLSLIKWREKPLFFKRLFLIVPPFILLHFLIAIMAETRVLIPLFLILVPMGLCTLFPKNLKINKISNNHYEDFPY